MTSPRSPDRAAGSHSSPSRSSNDHVHRVDVVGPGRRAGYRDRLEGRTPRADHSEPGPHVRDPPRAGGQEGPGGHRSGRRVRAAGSQRDAGHVEWVRIGFRPAVGPDAGEHHGPAVRVRLRHRPTLVRQGDVDRPGPDVPGLRRRHGSPSRGGSGERVRERVAGAVDVDVVRPLIHPPLDGRVAMWVDAELHPRPPVSGEDDRPTAPATGFGAVEGHHARHLHRPQVGVGASGGLEARAEPCGSDGEVPADS